MTFLLRVVAFCICFHYIITQNNEKIHNFLKIFYKYIKKQEVGFALPAIFKY